jgi:hypothetical protein
MTKSVPALTGAPRSCGIRALVIFKTTQCDSMQSSRTDFYESTEQTTDSNKARVVSARVAVRPLSGARHTDRSRAPLLLSPAVKPT